MGGKWKSEREKKHLLALLHRRGGRERLLDERRRDELELFERKKRRIKGDIWGKWGATYGRNGCVGEKKNPPSSASSFGEPKRNACRIGLG